MSKSPPALAVDLLRECDDFVASVDPAIIRTAFVFYRDRIEAERSDWVSSVFPGYLSFEIERVAQLFAPVNQARFDVLVVGSNDAVRVSKMLRTHVNTIPDKPKILLVRAMSPTDRAAALMAGFDDVIDYMRAKPEEVVARVTAMVRRYQIAASDGAAQDLADSRLARVADLDSLTVRERSVLQELIKRRGRPVSNALLCELISPGAVSASGLYLRVVICCLRKKLRDGASIVTRMGQGYELALDPASSW